MKSQKMNGTHRCWKRGDEEGKDSSKYVWQAKKRRNKKDYNPSVGEWEVWAHLIFPITFNFNVYFQVSNSVIYKVFNKLGKTEGVTTLLFNVYMQIKKSLCCAKKVCSRPRPPVERSFAFAYWNSTY